MHPLDDNHKAKDLRMKRLKYAQHVAERTLSAIKYTDLPWMNHILLEEMTVQSIQTMKPLCIQLHLNLLTQHEDGFACHIEFGLCLENQSNSSYIVWDAGQKNRPGKSLTAAGT